MDVISSTHNINLFWTRDGYLSFTNSPYYGHKNLSAVDLYPKFGHEEAVSPIDGKVKIAKKLELINDYIIILEATQDVYVKILHVKPSVNSGSEVSVGDILGEYIWSPFFHRWTDLHMHVELRPSGDHFRARGAFELDITPMLNYVDNFDLGNLDTQFRITEVGERYILLERDGRVAPYTSPLTLRFQGLDIYLDGGIPHYGHGAFIFLNKDFEKPPGDDVDFLRSNYIHFNCPGDPLKKGGKFLMGVGAYINRPFLKLIPFRSNRKTFEIGDELSFGELYTLFERSLNFLVNLQ